jgi:hypothetical protein
VKKLLLLLPLLLLTACERKPLDQMGYTIQHLDNIPELKGCVYLNFGDIKVIRCPNSSTTIQWVTGGKAKTTHRVTTAS